MAMTHDIQSLIGRSSIGEGLRAIRERGIDAHLAELEQESRAAAMRKRRGKSALASVLTPADRDTIRARR